MKYPLVSIIIPNFNREKLITETLDSILKQTYLNWECIVVDDGSTDKSEAVVNLYHSLDNRITFYKRPKNRPKGANSCRNFGLELSKGKYINWFDSDDLMHPDKLKLQVMALEKSDQLFCVCQSYVFEGNINTILELKSKQIITNNPFDDFLKKKLIIPIQAPIFNKYFLIHNNYSFDEELLAGQEWEFFAKILFNHIDYVQINMPLDYIRKHLNSVSGEITEKQLWYYFLARYKIYNLFKYQHSKENIIYLKRYFLLLYKLLLRKYAFKEASKIWIMVLFLDRTYTVKQHIYLITSFFSFYLFRKGDVFLTKVDRWDIEIKDF